MIKFIVDSTFGLTKEYASEKDIKLVNLKMILDEKETEEGFEDNWGEFYSRFEKSSNFPTTSQPNPECYDDAIKEILSSNSDADIFILTIASGLSGTINSANIAAARYNGNVRVIDSENACVACKVMIEELIEYTETAPRTADEVEEYIKDIKKRLQIQFVPDSMKYLKKGGRIGTLSAIVASITSIKPVFNFKNNKITVTQKVLGITKAAQTMIKNLPQKIKRMYVVYIHDNKNIKMLIEKIESMLGLKQVKVQAVSPVFGVHVGIGAFGIASLAE